MAVQTRKPAADPQDALAALQQARERTVALVAHLSDAQLERAYTPLMSPLVWDLAHIAAYEDLWLAQRLCGLELLRPDLAERYDAFETPRAVRGEIEILDHAGALG
jgi:gamma-glutamyl hercynylcysteine S-oxide synthase